MLSKNIPLPPENRKAERIGKIGLGIMTGACFLDSIV